MQSSDVTATFCATLVDEWCSLGVRHAVLSPGSRSTPMAMALGEAANLRLEVFHDERSAAFAALGAAKASGQPTLLLCTSGTAAANFYPAVIEAAHAEVPLIVLTADRPPELQGVGAPQTIDQKHLYGGVARAYIDLGVADDERSDEWRRGARRAYASATGERPGPVQMNLPFREPLLGVVGPLPARDDSRSAARTKPIGTELLSKLGSRLRGRCGVIVVGERGVQLPAVQHLAQQLGWPILADPLSGCRSTDPNLIRHADAWLRDTGIASSMRPEAVLRFGALPASKVVNGWLRDSRAEVTAVTKSSFVIDPERQVSMHVVTDAEQLCADLAQVVVPCASSWLERWLAAESVARRVISEQLDDETTLSEPGVARGVLASLPPGSQLVVSSSMPIRDVEWYGGSTDHVRVLANRGVNGIDGVVSTAVGVAFATDRPTGLLIGDVAFLHDSNGLIDLVNRNVDLRVVVVDNRGGGIFSFLPQRSALGTDRFERLFGTPHESDLGALASAHGLRTTYVSGSAELRSSVARRGPQVIIVRTDRDANVARHAELQQLVIAAVKAG
jgi:2-succinyl-5-enolpyruvyl-6-hydroxy-3-cyclohexene-1-carboxylate synthase